MQDFVKTDAQGMQGKCAQKHKGQGENDVEKNSTAAVRPEISEWHGNPYKSLERVLLHESALRREPGSKTRF